MAMQAYLTIDTNNISNNASSPTSIGQVASTSSTNYNTITVVAFNAAALIPITPGSGVASGTRIYQPVVFTKYFDCASPLLWTALTTNQTLNQITCQFYRPDPSGSATPQNYFTIQWGTATLVGGTAYTPLVINPQNSFYQYMEDWSFTFKTVTWTHNPQGTTGSDSW